jgi:hypothetical protein
MKGWEGTYSFGCDRERSAATHWRTDFTNLGVGILSVIFDMLSSPLIIPVVCQTLCYHLRFSQQCCWIFRSAGMLYCIIRCVVPTCPMIQHHVPEYLIFINWTCWMEYLQLLTLHFHDLKCCRETFCMLSHIGWGSFHSLFWFT